MVAVSLRKHDNLSGKKEQGAFSRESKDPSIIRNYRGKLQWSGNLDETRTDK